MSVFARLKEHRPKFVLLVSPTSPHVVGLTKWLSANLGIERVAGHLKKRGHHAETYDTNLYAASGSGPSLEEKLNERNWDVVGFSVQEDTLVDDISNMNLAARICSDSVLVAGGHTALFDYQTILDKSPTHIVVLGEGEKPLLSLIEGRPFEEIPGIVVKMKSIPLSPSEFKEATESIDFENIPYERYWDYYVDLYSREGKEITPELSRVIHTVRIFSRNYCPMKCRFCSTINFLTEASGQRVVPMADISGIDLINLLKRIIRAHPRVENIYFTDDDFCSRRKQLVEFLHLVIEEKLPVSFIGFSRIDDLDDEVVGLMVKANFKSLHIGIENFQPEILTEFNKDVEVDTIEKNIALLNSHGIVPSVTFILCSPKSTLQWIENTTRRILDGIEKGTISPGVNVTVQPQKGSSFYEEYGDFEIQMKRIPGTDKCLKRVHFIKCVDPETREFQYRLLHKWTHFIDDVCRGGESHLPSPAQAPLKLKMVLEVINEIKSERGRPDQLRYSNMSTEEREALWIMLHKYSYGASL